MGFSKSLCSALRAQQENWCVLHGRLSKELLGTCGVRGAMGFEEMPLKTGL